MFKYALVLCLLALSLSSVACKTKFNCDATPEVRADKKNNFLSIIKHDPGCSINLPARCQNIVSSGEVQCKATYAECPVSTGCSDRGKFII